MPRARSSLRPHTERSRSGKSRSCGFPGWSPRGIPGRNPKGLLELFLRSWRRWAPGLGDPGAPLSVSIPWVWFRRGWDPGEGAGMSRRGSGNVFLAHPVLPGALRRWLRRAGCAHPVSLRVRLHPSGNGARDPRPLRSCTGCGALTQPWNSCGKSRSCFIGCSVGREEPRGDGAWPHVVPPAPGILGGCCHPGRLPHP